MSRARRDERLHAMARLELDTATLGPRGTYPWFTSLVLPRPIAWVSTRSASGVDNLAPHSFFTVASDEPPIVQFTSMSTKDSLRNVLATREFVVNLVPYALRVAANLSATDFPSTVSEFDAVGIQREPSRSVKPPRVAGSPAVLECVLEDTRTFGRSTVVFGRVLHIAVEEYAVVDGRPRVDLLDPVARLGGAEWCRIGEVFRLRRIPYSELVSNE
jgi:flavin reductase (DIM6/NTAB) family NADH-FMN oxidoreductase RutF